MPLTSAILLSQAVSLLPIVPVATESVFLLALVSVAAP